MHGTVAKIYNEVSVIQPKVTLSLSPIALVPRQVQNLRSVLNTNQPSLTLKWDRPKNAIADKDVTAYEISYRASQSRERYCVKTMKASQTSILLTRKSGLKPLTTYDFIVQARNAAREGLPSTISKYIGMYTYQEYIRTDS